MQTMQRLIQNRFFKYTTLAATCLAVTSFQNISLASDWVEDDVSEFRETQSQRRQRIDRLKEESEASPKENESTVFDTSSPTTTPTQSEESSTASTEASSGGSKPLEATISTFRKDYRRPSRFPGLDGFASNVMQNAPMVPLPQKDEAVNPGAYKSWLTATHPGEADKLERESIIEVKGKWDDSGHVLRSFGIPHKRISARELGDTNLEKVYIVVVNCAGDLPAEAILALRRYVGMGGYLLTTDWALDGVLKKAFPGFVTWNGGYTDSSVVDAVVVDPDPRLFKNMPQVASWKLDKKSQLVNINRPGPVRVLARSRLLSRTDPSQFGILAFTMDFRQGRILHLVGHFDNNSDRAFNNALPDPAPGIKISMRQALAANFIMQAIRNKREQN